MRFYLKKRRQPPAVIIVALIDILIVLVIFLLVTTSFTRMPVIRITLPESTTAKQSGPTESPPLVITIAPKGDVFLEAKPVTIPQLAAELRAAVARNPNLKIAIRPDTSVALGTFFRVWDVVREANLQDRVVPVLVKEAKAP
jgi:biopolymer transport protein ExbD